MNKECYQVKIADHVAVNTNITRIKKHRIHFIQWNYQAKDSELQFISNIDKTRIEINVKKLQFGCETLLRPYNKLLPLLSIA